MLNFENLFGRPPQFYKLVEDGYLIAIGTGPGGEEITADEYAEIAAIIAAPPTAPHGYDYRLTDALEWEPYELPPEPDPEGQPVDDPAEALALLLGGDGNG